MPKIYDTSLIENKKPYNYLLFIPFYGAILAFIVLIISKKRQDSTYPINRKFFINALYLSLFILPITIPAQILVTLYPDYTYLIFAGSIMILWLPANIGFLKVYARVNWEHSVAEYLIF